MNSLLKTYNYCYFHERELICLYYSKIPEIAIIIILIFASLSKLNISYSLTDTNII